MTSAILLYDGECLLCQQFEVYLSLRKKHGVQLLNARHADELVQELASRGYDINSGMILLLGDQVYHGPEALSHIQKLLKPGYCSSYWGIFQWKWLARGVYPVGKFLRSLLFWLQGRAKYKDIRKEETHS